MEFKVGTYIYFALFINENTIFASSEHSSLLEISNEVCCAGGINKRSWLADRKYVTDKSKNKLYVYCFDVKKELLSANQNAQYYSAREIVLSVDRRAILS